MRRTEASSCSDAHPAPRDRATSTSRRGSASLVGEGPESPSPSVSAGAFRAPPPSAGDDSRAVVESYDRSRLPGKEHAMGKLKVSISMSLDGYVAGPDQTEQNPLGIGGEQLHEWVVPLRAFREGHGRRRRRGQREHADRRGDPRQRRRDHHGPKHVRWRAWTVGRRPLEGLVGRQPALPQPGLRSHPPRRASRWSCRAEPPSTSSRMGSSRRSSRPGQPPATRTYPWAAVRVAAQQYLAAGLLDEIVVSIVPVLLGSGARLFDNLGDAKPRPRAGRGDRGARSHAHQIRARVDGLRGRGAGR